MNRIVYVNGEYVAEQDAKISIFDRGFLFSDGVYEVSSILRGKLIDNNHHLARLNRSMQELQMRAPLSDAEIIAAQEELIKINKLEEGLLYMQVTRGAADRDFAWTDDLQPSLVMFTQVKSLIHSPIAKRGISVITTPEIRWQRRDIKTTGLLAACMAKVIARDAGADDAWLVDEAGYITEGSSNNAYILTQDNTLVTRHLSNAILHGITRKAILKLVQSADIKIDERPFTAEEALNATEAFITSASTFVWPVISIDGHTIGSGEPGPTSASLRQAYIQTALAESNE